MQSSLTSNDLINLSSGSIILAIVITTVPAVLGILLFIKVWMACNDIQKMRSLLDDVAYWSDARYASEKRRGLIIESDLEVADKVSTGK